ncbi:MAG: chaperone modulator CbpM [Nitrospira sp.]|jgi:chaperone modulatory protein CbpM|nr:chaperone modulator CbpM [Nitrospira sp.]MDH5193203.1 chaperone modulator CbpM [Nitrospira sp.]
MDMENEILIGSVVGDEGVLALEELARACGAEVEWIVELVAVGVLAPEGRETTDWRFRAVDLTCARRVARLQRDFGASLEAAAVMIDLLKQIDQLHARLKQAGLNVD